jgi:ABC-type transport system involved in Fe-S cluster assembly fused permease/ATPase subunit
MRGRALGLTGAGACQVAFDIYLGVIVLVSMVGYMGVTIWITEWRTRFRRASNDADNDARQKGAPVLRTHAHTHARTR